MIVNGQKLTKHKSSLNLNHWTSTNKGVPNYGDLWYQPDSCAVDYPLIKGRLLVYLKEVSLNENDYSYYDNWVEIRIRTVESEEDDTKSPVQLVIDKYKKLHSIVRENYAQEENPTDAVAHEYEMTLRMYSEFLRDLRNLL